MKLISKPVFTLTFSVFFLFSGPLGFIFGDTLPHEQSLQGKLYSTVDLSGIKMGAPLNEAISHIQNSFEPPLPIVIDWDELAKAGINPTDRAYTRGWVRTTGGEALQTVLFTVSKGKEILLDYAVYDDHILITNNPHGLIKKTYTLTEQQTVDISGKPLTNIQLAAWIKPKLSELLERETGAHLYPIQQLKITENQITVLQTSENHEKIADIILNLTSPDFRQIAIEARLIFATDSFCQEIGVNIDQQGIDAASQFNIAVNSLPVTSISGPANSELVRALLDSTITPDVPLVEAPTVDDFQRDLFIRATHAHRNVKIVASPKVTGQTHLNL